MQFFCELLFASITFIALTVGAIQDILTRYTSNKIWIIQGASGFILLIICGIIEPYTPLELIGIGLNIAFAVFFGFLFLLIGAWGAGDTKALFALGISSPIVFSFIKMEIPPQLSLVPLFLIIANFVYAIAILIFTNLIWNLLSLRKFGNWFKETNASIFIKLVTVLTAVQIPLDKLKVESFLDPIETFNEKWHIEFSIFNDYNQDDEILEQQEKKLRKDIREKADETGRKYIWVRPQIPGLVIFWLSYIIWIFFGSAGVTIISWVIGI